MTIAKDVVYCRICSIPPEFCSFTPSAERCKRALQQDNAALYARLHEPSSLDAELAEKLQITGEPATAQKEAAADADAEAADAGDDRKHQSRGGKGLIRDESALQDKEAAKRAKARVQIKRTDRNKRKAVTHIRGLELFGLDLRRVAKRLAGKYACGASVVKDNAGQELVDVQGDFVDDLLDFLPKEYPEVKAKQIDVLEK